MPDGIAIFELLMILCFGVSWPFSIAKMLKTKQSSGKSAIFLWFVLIGYACGITYRILDYKWVLFFYCLNFVMVAIDLILYLRYRRPKD
jgi:hypothetical protein